jgi:cytochrome P450
MSAGSDLQRVREPHHAVAFLDLFDPAFQPDAPPVHAAREACWYARTPLGYAVLRYDEVAALLRDRRLRQGSAEPLAAQGLTEGLLADWMRMSLLTLEGEPHARLRRLVSQAFTPRAVDALRPTMRATAHELIDGFAARGACEFMAAFADPYPSRLLAALLGIPPERYPSFHGWATEQGLLFSYAVAEHRPGSRRRSWAWPPASMTCSPSGAPPPDPP